MLTRSKRRAIEEKEEEKDDNVKVVKRKAIMSPHEVDEEEKVPQTWNASWIWSSHLHDSAPRRHLAFPIIEALLKPYSIDACTPHICEYLGARMTWEYPKVDLSLPPLSSVYQGSHGLYATLEHQNRHETTERNLTTVTRCNGVFFTEHSKGRGFFVKDDDCDSWTLLGQILAAGTHEWVIEVTGYSNCDFRVGVRHFELTNPQTPPCDGWFIDLYSGNQGCPEYFPHPPQNAHDLIRPTTPLCGALLLPTRDPHRSEGNIYTTRVGLRWTWSGDTSAAGQLDIFRRGLPSEGGVLCGSMATHAKAPVRPLVSGSKTWVRRSTIFIY